MTAAGRRHAPGKGWKSRGAAAPGWRRRLRFEPTAADLAAWTRLIAAAEAQAPRLPVLTAALVAAARDAVEAMAPGKADAPDSPFGQLRDLALALEGREAAGRIAARETLASLAARCRAAMPGAAESEPGAAGDEDPPPPWWVEAED